MSKLFNILDGIVSDKEFGEQNLEQTSAIISYAESAGEIITDDEAKRIQEVGKTWLAEQRDGNGEWGRMRGEAERALED
jgi:hypothetical protein